MQFQQVRNEFEKLTPEQLAKSKPDQVYRMWMLRFLFEIYGSIDSLAFCYREMLKIQQSKSKG